jgi:hypothetical protein
MVIIHGHSFECVTQHATFHTKSNNWWIFNTVAEAWGHAVA